MLRFAYLTDTHLGCSAEGYFLQPRYLDQQQALYAGLARWLQQQQVNFVVHGGDMVDKGTAEQIQVARTICDRLGLPVYLCLGNHDLSQPDSLKHWQTLGRDLLPTGQASYPIDAGPVWIYVIGHHWHDGHDHYWMIDQPQHPRLDAQQLAELDRFLAAADRPVIAMTHAPLNGIAPKAWGQSTPFHPPHQPYLDVWHDLGRRHSALRLVLAGHNHAHSCHDHGSFISCTTAAFNEVPAQLRLITVTNQSIELETRHLAQPLGLPAIGNPEKAWSTGLKQDHTLRLTL